MEVLERLWDFIHALNSYPAWVTISVTLTIFSILALIAAAYSGVLFSRKFWNFLSSKLTKNLANANIRILANGSSDDLKGTIVSSGIFNQKNIKGVAYDKDTDFETLFNEKQIDLLVIDYRELTDVFPGKAAEDDAHHQYLEEVCRILGLEKENFETYMEKLSKVTSIRMADNRANACDDLLIKMINRLGEHTFFIIFAPHAAIPGPTMGRLGQKSNLAVTNFKGRLLSDIFTSLVTRPNS